MPGAGTIIQGALGLAKTVEGLVNAGKTKREAKYLEKTRPQLGRDRYADEALALTKSELAQGMSAKAEKAYNDIADRDFSSSLSAILKGGGNLNSIGDIYGSKEEGRQRLAIMQDNLRLSQIQNEINAGKEVSNREDQMFQINQWMPWADKSQANAAARQGAQEQIWSGLGTMGAGAMQYFGGKDEAAKLGLNSPSNRSAGGGTSYSNYNDILGISKGGGGFEGEGTGGGGYNFNNDDLKRRLFNVI